MGQVGVGGRFKREGIYVYLWLIHIVLQQKPIQHCKAIILQLKINLKKEKSQGGERESKGWYIKSYDMGEKEKTALYR